MSGVKPTEDLFHLVVPQEAGKGSVRVVGWVGRKISQIKTKFHIGENEIVLKGTEATVRLSYLLQTKKVEAKDLLQVRIDLAKKNKEGKLTNLIRQVDDAIALQQPIILKDKSLQRKFIQASKASLRDIEDPKGKEKAIDRLEAINGLNMPLREKVLLMIKVLPYYNGPGRKESVSFVNQAIAQGIDNLRDEIALSEKDKKIQSQHMKELKKLAECVLPYWVDGASINFLKHCRECGYEKLERGSYCLKMMERMKTHLEENKQVSDDDLRAIALLALLGNQGEIGGDLTPEIKRMSQEIQDKLPKPGTEAYNQVQDPQVKSLLCLVQKNYTGTIGELVQEKIGHYERTPSVNMYMAIIVRGLLDSLTSEAYIKHFVWRLRQEADREPQLLNHVIEDLNKLSTDDEILKNLSPGDKLQFQKKMEIVRRFLSPANR